MADVKLNHDERMRAEGALSALDIAGERIASLEAEVTKLRGFLRDYHQLRVMFERRVAELEESLRTVLGRTAVGKIIHFEGRSVGYSIQVSNEQVARWRELLAPPAQVPPMRDGHPSTIYCGTWVRREDGEVLEGPLVKVGNERALHSSDVV